MENCTGPIVSMQTASRQLQGTGTKLPVRHSSVEILYVYCLRYVRLCRYGWSPYFQHRLTSSIVNKFLKIYDLQDKGITFSSALHLWKGLGLDHLLRVSLTDDLRESTKLFGMHTINSHFINEVVAGQVRVNYNQNPHEMAALAGLLFRFLFDCLHGVGAAEALVWPQGRSLVSCSVVAEA
jgi:hypothetical protein